MIISACPDGWEWKPEFSKCYYIIHDYMNWYEANDACMALDPDGQATLSSVKSQEEMVYITSLIHDIYSWIGGTDEAEEGVWRWVNLRSKKCHSLVIVTYTQGERSLKSIWGHPLMTSTLRGEGGFSGNVDKVREVAWTYSVNQLTQCGKARGDGGQKI